MTPSTHKRLDRKLDAIRDGRYTPADFIIADAKDADMAFGVMAPGTLPGSAFGDVGPGRYRTRQDYLADMQGQIALDAIDIILTSASNGEELTRRGSLSSDMTLAVRANDSTDIWTQRGATSPGVASRPFRTVDLASVRPFCDLVLYSVTLNDDVDRDLATLTAFKEFRAQAHEVQMRYFLEVFNPNATTLKPGDVGAFVNDSIVRMLAGVTTDHRPLFMKMQYNGAAALAELAQHDSSLVIGLLGGSSGTTRDTFELLHRGQESGARVALFGRKIQRAESQFDLVALMRPVLEGAMTPADGVRAYHAALAEQGIAPARSLNQDLEVSDPVLRGE